jgi:hypothetical protein
MTAVREITGQTHRVPAIIDLNMSTLATDTLIYQVEAFSSYQSRGGRFSFEEWMDTKGFNPRDRASLRAIWTRRQRNP